jgi:tRNA(fMet)-specific endonuclease VapC
MTTAQSAAAPRYLLDTNACIALRDLRRGQLPRDDAARQKLARLQQRLSAEPPQSLAMSLISLGELRYGADKSANPTHGHDLLDKLQQLVSVMLLDEATASHYGQVRHQLASSGQTIGVNDTWIAAHALAAGLTVVTHNQREFKRVPHLQIEDWTA